MRRVAAVILLWAVLVVPAMLSRGYWNPDEGRYGAVAREVWRGDGALVPHLNGEVYGEKPPLFFWITAGCQMLTGGVSAAASRIPSVLATLGTALLLFGLVRRTHGEKEGEVAAAVFLTSALVVQTASWVAIDPLVTCLVTGCLYFQERSFLASRGRWRFVGVTYLLLAAILLSKGAPAIIALVALGAAAWLRGGPRALLARHMLWGVPLMLLLLAAWAVPAAREVGWDHLRGLTIDQADRRLVDSDSHQAPVYYYLLRFPLFFFPWILLLPAVVRRAVLDWRSGGGDRASTGRYMLWFVVPFLLFSLVSGKRERYILPLFAPAAAITGITLVRLEAGPWFRRLVRIPMHVTLGALGALGLCIAAAAWLPPETFLSRAGITPPAQMEEAALVLRATRYALFAGGVSVVLVALEALLRRRDRAPVVPVCAAVGFLVVTLCAGVLPVLDRFKSVEPLTRAAVAKCPPDARWVLLGLKPGPFCVAMDRHDLTVLRERDCVERAAKMMASDDSVVVVAREDAYRSLVKLMEQQGVPLTLHLVRRLGRRTVFVAERSL